MNNDWREFYDPEYVLAHHGIKGQKWGVRRFQTDSGALTAEGKKRYAGAMDSSGVNKVDHHLTRAGAQENLAVRAKTSIGRNYHTAKAIKERIKADKVAEKVTGKRKLFAVNKNQARDLGAEAETHANIAKKFKEKADKTEDSKQKEKLMNRAISNLATANNVETHAKAYQEIARAKGVVDKGVTYINQMHKLKTADTYSAAGRKSSHGDKVVEAIGDKALNTAFGIATGGRAGSNTLTGLSGALRDASYKKKYSADERWNKLANG